MAGLDQEIGNRIVDVDIDGVCANPKFKDILLFAVWTVSQPNLKKYMLLLLTSIPFITYIDVLFCIPYQAQRGS